MANPQPTIEDVQEVQAHLSERWREAREDWAVRDTYCDGTFEVWDKPEHKHRSAFKITEALDIVNHAVDNQMAVDPEVTRQTVGRGDSDAAIADADAVEEFCKASLLDSFLRQMELPSKAFALSLIRNGYGTQEAPIVLLEGRPEKPHRKERMTDEEWEAAEGQYEGEAAGFNPFRVRVYHPSRILLDPSERIPTYGIKQGYWYGRDLSRIARSLRDQGKKVVWDDSARRFQRFRLSDYRDTDWHVVVVTPVADKELEVSPAVTGEIFLAEENIAGFVGFNHAFSGWGSEPEDGDDDPKYKAQGILTDGLLNILKYRAQTFSGIHNVLMNRAYAQRWTTLSSDAAKALEGSDVLYDSGPDQWGVVEMPDLPREIMGWLNELNGMMEFGSFARILAGQRPEGVTTVGATALHSTQAQQKFLSPGKQLDFVYSQLLSDELRWIDANGETVTIRGKSIGPKQIRHNYAIEVKFELVNPVIHLQEKQLAMDEFKLFLISWESYQDVARRGNTTQERRRLYRDLLFKHPLVQDLVAQAIFRGVKLDEILKAMEEGAQGPTFSKVFPGAAAPPSGLLGPDGNPLASTIPGAMGAPTANPAEPGSPREAAIAGRQIAQPLGMTGGVMAGVKPPGNIALGRNGA